MTRRATSLTPQGFAGLLRTLAADKDEAGRRYETLRRKLLWLFESRGSRTPEDDADETLSRLARKLEAGDRIEDLSTYALGVARFVLLESVRRPQETGLTAEIEQRAAVPADDPIETEQRSACMEHCLSSFSAAERELILTYYLGERRSRIDSRRRLAATLGIPIPALRIRAFRIRQRLHGCVVGCVDRLPAATDTHLPAVQGAGSRLRMRAGSAGHAG